MNEILALFTRLVERSGLSESEFTERILGRSRATPYTWFSGKFGVPAPMARYLRSIKRVEIHGDEIILVLRYAAPTRSSPRQRELHKLHAAAKRGSLAGDSGSKQKPSVAAAKRVKGK